jgi:hypothetical protein
MIFYIVLLFFHVYSFGTKNIMSGEVWAKYSPTESFGIKSNEEREKSHFYEKGIGLIPHQASGKRVTAEKNHFGDASSSYEGYFGEPNNDDFFSDEDQGYDF